MQAFIISLAGGGVMAMILQSVVPEAYKGTHEYVSVFGALGYSSIFILAKIISPH
jgi:ZIP family zinc transporter